MEVGYEWSCEEYETVKQYVAEFLFGQFALDDENACFDV